MDNLDGAAMTLPTDDEERRLALEAMKRAEYEQRTSGNAHRLRAKRLAAEAGISVAEADARLNESYATADSLPDALWNSGITQEIADRQNAEQAEREQNLAQYRRYNSSSPAANFQHMLEDMPEDWRNVVMADNMTRRLQQNMTPLNVQAAQGAGEARIRELVAQGGLDEAARLAQNQFSLERFREELAANAARDAAARAEADKIRDQNFEFRMKELDAAGEKDAAERALTIAEMEQRNALALEEIKGKKEAAEPQRLAAETAARKLESDERLAWATNNPGAYQIATDAIGEEGQEMLKRMATENDVDWGLGPWRESFGARSVAGMGNALRTLGQQLLASKAVPEVTLRRTLLDNKYVSKLVNKYGRGSGFAGGRGGWVGDRQIKFVNPATE